MGNKLGQVLIDTRVKKVRATFTMSIKEKGKKQDELGKKKFTRFFSVIIQCVGERAFNDRSVVIK